MAKVAVALVPASLRSAWRVPADLRAATRPLLWLVVGLLASYVYMDLALFSAALFEDRLPVPTLPVPLFPPQAIILAVLLLTPTRRWWVYLLVYYVMQVAQGEWDGLPRWYTLLSNGANVVEPLVGATLFRRLVPRFTEFTHLREVSIYVGCVVLAATLGASWGAAARAIQGFPFWVSWQGWFLGDVLASLVLAPTIILWAGAGLQGLRPRSPARAVEATLLYGGLLVVGWGVFSSRVHNSDTADALLYLPVPLLVWAAVRFGPRGLLSGLSLVTVLAIEAMANARGPAIGGSITANVLTLQLFLLGVGTPLFILAALVRDREEAQAELEQSEARYRAVVSNFPHGVVLLFGLDFRHTFADGQGLPELGLSRQSVEGQSLSEAFPDEVAAALTPRYETALAGAHASCELVHAGRTYQAEVVPFSPTGAAMGMLVMQDVTEQRRAELLAELDRAKTAFFNNVSHEFRTPLTLLLGPLEETLAAPPARLGADERQQLQTAHRNALRLLKLVNSLLDFSRLEAGRLQPAYAPTDLAAFTAELASLFHSAVERAGLELRVDCPPLPEPVYVDRDQWEQIVLNLLSNALKFTFAGTIAVTLRAEGEQVVLAVRDTGTGIPTAELPHIFERFHRVPGTQARTQEGTGIGLALVRDWVELHGGTVDVTSAVGEGSTFTVVLPRGTAHLPSHQVQEAADAAHASSAAAYVEEVRSWLPDDRDTGPPDREPAEALGVAACRLPNGRAVERDRELPARILIADDNADTRAYLVRLLQGHGAVQAVGDGATALEVARAWEPDLVLTDVMMPGLDGFALLQAVRADPQLRATSVILLSARAGEQTRAEGLRAGADDYLVKPFSAPELLARVDGQLALVRLRGEARAATERQHVAADLHDSVMQEIYGLTLLAEAGRRALAGGQPAQVEEYLKQVGQSAQWTLREMRLLVHALRPHALAQGGLIEALEQRLNAVERRAGIVARLQVRGEIVLAPAAEEAFYYIAQEALTNALKHASPSEVEVRIGTRRAVTTLVVADNGRGFDPGGVAGRGGLGLVTMRERAARVGATLAIKSAPRGGTRVTVRLRTAVPPSGPAPLRGSRNGAQAQSRGE
ncbi:MAG TPA: ATP-binding protein [Chloroflexota bacterium]|jgi:signal transduction histidine kinase